jgi:hypothetical protein
MSESLTSVPIMTRTPGYHALRRSESFLDKADRQEGWRRNVLQKAGYTDKYQCASDEVLLEAYETLRRKDVPMT